MRAAAIYEYVSEHHELVDSLSNAVDLVRSTLPMAEERCDGITDEARGRVNDAVALRLCVSTYKVSKAEYADIGLDIKLGERSVNLARDSRRAVAPLNAGRVSVYDVERGRNLTGCNRQRRSEVPFCFTQPIHAQFSKPLVRQRTECDVDVAGSTSSFEFL